VNAGIADIEREKHARYRPWLRAIRLVPVPG
jgi:hypothetical protein